MYLDLFDDGLYPVAKRQDPVLVGLENHIRVSAFIHFLFGNGPLIVPEQWAVSSAACIDVLSEMVAGYEKHVADCKHRAPLRPPIEFGCMERNSEIVGYVPVGHDLAAAFWERVHLGKRLRTTPFMDTEKSSDVRLDRMKLTTLLHEVTTKEENSYGNDFKERLGSVIEDRDRSHALGTIFSYNHTYKCARNFSNDSYQGALEQYALTVEDHLQNAPSTSLGTRILDTFDDAKVGGIRLNRYVDLLGVWRSIDPTDDVKFQHVMRLGMHSALAGNLRSRSHSFAYMTYERDDLTTADEILNLAGLASDRPSTSPSNWLRAPYHLVTRRARDSRFDDIVDWSGTWKAVFDLRNSERVQSVRRKLYAQAIKNSHTAFPEGPAHINELVEIASRSLDDFRMRAENGVVHAHVAPRRAGIRASDALDLLKSLPLSVGGVATMVTSDDKTIELLGGIAVAVSVLIAAGKAFGPMISDIDDETDAHIFKSCSVLWRKRTKRDD